MIETNENISIIKKILNSNGIENVIESDVGSMGNKFYGQKAGSAHVRVKGVCLSTNTSFGEKYLETGYVTDDGKIKSEKEMVQASLVYVFDEFIEFTLINETYVHALSLKMMAALVEVNKIYRVLDVSYSKLAGSELKVTTLTMKKM